jgi:hypothetical protein
MRVLVSLLIKQLNSKTKGNFLRFYGSEARCESAPWYVRQIYKLVSHVDYK